MSDNYCVHRVLLEDAAFPLNGIFSKAEEVYVFDASYVFLSA